MFYVWRDSLIVKKIYEGVFKLLFSIILQVYSSIALTNANQAVDYIDEYDLEDENIKNGDSTRQDE